MSQRSRSGSILSADQLYRRGPLEGPCKETILVTNVLVNFLEDIGGLE